MSEPVNYISCRSSLLATLFFLVADAVMTPVRSHPVQWATQIKAGIYYLWTVIMPTRLSVEPQFKQRGLNHVVILALLLLIFLGTLGFRGCRNHRLAAFGVAWFVLSLMPSSLVLLHILVDEHRLYLPMVGVALIIAGLSDGFRQRPVVGGPVLLALLSHMVQRNRVWVNKKTFWRRRGQGTGDGPLPCQPRKDLSGTGMTRRSCAHQLPGDRDRSRNGKSLLQSWDGPSAPGETGTGHSSLLARTGAETGTF